MIFTLIKIRKRELVTYSTYLIPKSTQKFSVSVCYFKVAKVY